jgi:cell wall-associated NlpC family hydrolase
VRDKARPLAALAVGIGLVGVGAGFGGAGGSSSATPLTGSAQLTSYTRAFPGSTGSTSGAATQSAGATQSTGGTQSSATAATESSTAAKPVVAPLHGLRQADLIVVASTSLPSGVLARIRKLSGVTAAESLEAARVQLNGKYTAVLGVNPSTFRSYAAKQTAASDKLWQSVASGAVSVSYTMGQDDKLKAGGTVHANGAKQENLRVGGLGTVGIEGVDAVVSDQVARSLGVPAGNAIVISAPKANLAKLVGAVKKVIPHGAAAEPLMSQVTAGVTKTQISAAGVAAGTVDHSSTTLSAAEDLTFLKAGLGRQGLPYVWGASGPNSFDCSGLVQWAMARAGIQMPRVAADQARTGPAVPVSQLQPGDLLFYHTDPTDPGYISHVAIYLGNDEMLQAPQTGENVEVVKADLSGSEYAGAVRVDPALAAQVAGNI